MRTRKGTFVLLAMLSVYLGCGGFLEGEGPESPGMQETPDGRMQPMPDQSPVLEPFRILARGTVPAIPYELSGLARGDGFFFALHRNNANGYLVVTQLLVEDWSTGKLKSLSQGSIPFVDPEGLSYIDKQGAAWRFVAAGERGQLSIVEMNGNTLTNKVTKAVGTYDNEGIEGVCYYNGYVYYGIQKDGKVYRVRFDPQKGLFGDAIEPVVSNATSIRDMTVIGNGLYSITSNRLTRIAGAGPTEIQSPVSLVQLEGMAYAVDQRVLMLVGEPNEYAMFTY